jgi:hypothetical protein
MCEKNDDWDQEKDEKQEEPELRATLFIAHITGLTRVVTVYSNIS